MRLLRDRRERRAVELRELEVFRTLRGVVAEDVRALTAVGETQPDVAAVRRALDAAASVCDLVNLEPQVVAAWSRYGLSVADGRQIRIGGRSLDWDRAGCYRGVAEAAREAFAHPGSAG